MASSLRVHLRLAAMLFGLTAFALIVRAQGGSTIATERIFEAIGVKEGVTVCEIGAGNGDLSLAAARLVGPTGRVFTSELGDDRVKTLQTRVTSSGLAQITVVSGDPVRTNFPEAGCDALFMRNVYHHFADPAPMNASIAASLRPGARLAVVDFTPPAGAEAKAPADRSKDGSHGIGPESVSRELKTAGLDVVTSEAGTGRWFMVVAAKPKTGA